MNKYQKRVNKRLRARYDSAVRGGNWTEAYRLAKIIIRNDSADNKSQKIEKNVRKQIDIGKEKCYNIYAGKGRMDAEEPALWITTENGHRVPLNKEGKALAGGGGTLKGKDFSGAKSENAKDKSSSSANPKSKEKSGSSSKKNPVTRSTIPLAINTPEAREVYDNIKAGNYYSAEELRNHPVMKQMDTASAECSAKYPGLEKDNSPERVAMRKQVLNGFLKQGSAVEGEDGKYEFTGKIDKGYEAEIVIGLPASGKSSTIANPDSESMHAFIFDSDMIKEEIPEFKETNGMAADAVHKESKQMLKDAFSEFQEGGKRNGENLIVPVIGDDYDNLFKKWITPLEEAGYNVKIKFKDTDPVQSLNRNVARAISTGRVIPSNVALGYGDKPREVYQRFVNENKKNARGNSYV